MQLLSTCVIIGIACLFIYLLWWWWNPLHGHVHEFTIPDPNPEFKSMRKCKHCNLWTDVGCMFCKNSVRGTSMLDLRCKLTGNKVKDFDTCDKFTEDNEY